MEGDFSGQVVLVTGGGKGIGRAIAVELARRGARVAISGRDEAAIAAVAKETGALAVQMDVRQEDSIQQRMQSVLDWGGRLDILVNNAGIGLLSTSLTETQPQKWRDVIDTNLTGPYMVSRAAWPHLAASKGQILNISSVAGTRGFQGASAYCASKFGLNGLNEVLKMEGAAVGIRVLAMCPGAISTEIWGDLATDAEKHKMMTPEQIGALAAQMLATPRNIDLGNWVILNSIDPFSG
ncbi:MAG: SDR family oxidoreductase [Chthonomonas sp.]|nr:SDR family oxidoreductase [Chthonomonas sp.]